MLSGKYAAAGLLIVLAIAVCTRADRPNPETFGRDELLSRFDHDRDEQLSHSERVDLRDAFGGIDVPLLPNQPYRYVETALPSHIDAGVLKGMDNTPQDNPLTDAGAALGRVLFYDKQFSRDATISCASCHLQQHAFSDPRQLSIGLDGVSTRRNAMSLANLRYTVIEGHEPGFFWDERAATLEAQVLMPIQDPTEMGMELPELEARLRGLPYYPPLFQAAFGSSEITSERIAKAVSQFVRAMTSFDAKFDRAAQAMGDVDYTADFDDFTDEENWGKALFLNGVGGIAEIGCAHCHVPPTFGMPRALNNGLEMQYQDQGLGLLDVVSNDPLTANNDGKFKAPSLRNIELTAPYMHDGRFRTLEEVLEHYSSSVHPHPNVALAFHREATAGADEPSGFQLTAGQKAALVAFLKTLTDERFLSDERFADPFVRLKN